MCDSILILNISAAIKMILALTVGVLGIVYVVKNGFVNDMAFRTFLPGFDLHSLSYISVIIFNFLGFEVVCTYADNMRDPKRQIPQAIITGGIVIALIYLFSAFGIGAAHPYARDQRGLGPHRRRLAHDRPHERPVRRRGGTAVSHYPVRQHDLMVHGRELHGCLRR